MNFEQEIASIIAFTLEKADNPNPYYYSVPESFVFPAMFFPQPEIITRGETFHSYAMEYAWYINVFAETTEEAYQIALSVLMAIKDRRNLVPLIGTNGKPIGSQLRLNDPELRPVDTGVVQITIAWTSRRPYDCDDSVKMQTWEVEGWSNPDIYIQHTIETALRHAIDDYLTEYPRPEHAEAGT